MTVCVWDAEGGIVMKGRSIVRIEKEMVCFGEIVSFEMFSRHTTFFRRWRYVKSRDFKITFSSKRAAKSMSILGRLIYSRCNMI